MLCQVPGLKEHNYFTFHSAKARWNSFQHQQAFALEKTGDKLAYPPMHRLKYFHQPHHPKIALHFHSESKTK